LIRPDLRRAELVAWRQKRMGEPVTTRADLETRREKLRRDRDNLEAELREIEEALAKIVE
jgi:RNA polymerase-binding transcription factor DksA